jgi:7-cyano-7-deazaguanine synthase
VNLRGYGDAFPSGLTHEELDVNADAFLPGRNLVLLLTASAYASRIPCGKVAIGLLDETARLFPDQSRAFADLAEIVISEALGTPISIVTPLISWPKAAVVEALSRRGLGETYSCHAGLESPCGRCISCLEIAQA